MNNNLPKLTINNNDNFNKNDEMTSAPFNNKKKIILKNPETHVSRVILINCILDFKFFLRKNFLESKKGYYGLGLISLFFLNRKRPFIYSIKNNYEFSNSLIAKNKIIKVNPIRNALEAKLNTEQASNANKNAFKFTYSFEYKHINNAYRNLTNFKNLFFSIFNRAQLGSESKEKVHFENEEGPKAHSNQESRELEVLTGIDVKLCGIKDLNEEGKMIAEKLIFDKSSKIYLQFNHILYMDTPEIYCWVYLKNRKLSFSKINLNVFLVKQGLGNVNPVKLSDVYDEKIYYNYSDLFDAERNAKEKGLGIWGNKRSKVITESAIKNERFGSFFERFGKRLNMRGWEKSILNK